MRRKLLRSPPPSESRATTLPKLFRPTRNLLVPLLGRQRPMFNWPDTTGAAAVGASAAVITADAGTGPVGGFGMAAGMRTEKALVGGRHRLASSGSAKTRCQNDTL